MVGTVELVPAGAVVYDAAFPPPAPALAADGGAAILRYYAPAPDGSPRLELNAKNMHTDEPGAYAAAGLAVGINGEWGELTMFHGTVANLELGTAVRVGCDRDGVPDAAPLWWSCDTQCDAPQFELTRPAFDAYRSTNPANPFGLYSNSWHIEWALAEGLAELGWIASAPYWSRLAAGGRPDRDGLADGVTVFRYPADHTRPFQFNYYLTPLAHLYQFGQRVIAGATVDLNLARRAAPFWYPGGVTPPNPREVPMPNHITYAKSPGRGIVELVATHEGPPKWRATPGEGGAVFACFPGGESTIPDVGDAELDTMGEYDAAADARWFLSQAPAPPPAGVPDHEHTPGGVIR